MSTMYWVYNNKYTTTLYNWCILLKLTSGFVNRRKWCSLRLNCHGEHDYHFRGLTYLDINLNQMHKLFCYMTIILAVLQQWQKWFWPVLDLSLPICYMTTLAVWQQSQKWYWPVLDLSKAAFKKQHLILANIRICENLLQPGSANQRRPLLAVI